jgi:carbamoylphosphate synthase large subunit
MDDTLFVLYQNSGVYSGRALRKMLASLHKGRVIGGYPNRFASTLRKNTPDCVINLGTTGEISYKGKIVNPRDMVRSASNKRAARIAFQEADVPAPQLFLRGSDVTKAELPVIGRTSYHNKGKGFWFCKTLAEVQRAVERGATHFLEFVPKTREYRVHAFCKKKAFGKEDRKADDYASVKLVEKVWQGKDKPDPKKVQKNHEFGWVFLGQQDRREEELDVVRFAAKQAMAALGLDFGAVDVMYKIMDKRPYVLEVNSTPSLADETADTCEVYAKRILSMLGSKTEKE